MVTTTGVQKEVVIPEKIKETMQTLKEIAPNFSDSEIYNTLRESNMEPNETVHKLLNQDPFHEVRRRRDKKKENAVDNDVVEQKRPTEYVSQGSKVQGSDRYTRRGGHARTGGNDAGMSRQFRVVRDNRVNQNSDREQKASSQALSSFSGPRITNPSGNNHRHYGRHVQTFNGTNDFRSKVARDVNSSSRREHFEERKSAGTSTGSQVSTVKPSDSQSPLGSSGTSNIVGVYASASDPVHVPSPDSRTSTAIGAPIRREFGVVGGRRQSSDSTSKKSLQPSIFSNLNSALGSSSTAETVRSVNPVPRNDQTHSSVVEAVVTNSSGNRLGSHFNSRVHQQPAGHHKGVFPSKEWKPKTNQKPSSASPGVIGSPVKSSPKVAGSSNNGDRDTEVVTDKLAQVNVHESENVIIAQHIRIPENDRCRVTFGSFGSESDDTGNSTLAHHASESADEALEPSSSEQINAVDEQVRSSGSSSPSSGESPETQLAEKQETPIVSTAENYGDVGLVHNSPSFITSKQEPHQEPADLSHLSSYDPQPVYDIPYFRPSIEDGMRGPGVPSPQEGLSSHTANSIPASSIAMMQQQGPMAQMYPQVHVSHFANVMPYRQYLPPMYVPPMVPGYSGNPGYSHLSNGSSYLLMPNSGSHIPANNLKYGVQQFKPLPAGSPSGFGSFANPNGYAMNAPGVVGGPTGLDDPSRLKYKDNNLYVPNPQADTSEVWMQNHREMPGMQSTPYFSMQGQTPHPAYLQSHTGHASYNAAAVAQSSHMQYPGMYPPQPATIPNAHHMGSGNMGVGVAPATPGGQVGAYQQPQMSHLNWTTNF